MSYETGVVTTELLLSNRILGTMWFMRCCINHTDYIRNIMETQKKSRVFAVCEPTHTVAGETVKHVNLKPALEYGDVIVLLKHNQALFNTVPMVRELRDKLADFSDNDYIIPVGDPVLMSVVAMVAADINKGRINFLKWDKHIKGYYSIQVDSYGRAL